MKNSNFRGKGLLRRITERTYRDGGFSYLSIFACHCCLGDGSPKDLFVS